MKHYDISHIDAEFIKECIKTNELQLANEEKHFHFYIWMILIALFVLILGIGVLLLVNEFISHNKGVNIFIALASIIFAAYFADIVREKKQNQLKFEIIQPNIAKHTSVKLIKQVAKNLDIEFSLIKPNILVGITNASKFVNGHERITIIFSQKRILFNSISQPVYMMSSWFPPNEENIEMFINRFENYLQSDPKIHKHLQN